VKFSAWVATPAILALAASLSGCTGSAPEAQRKSPESAPMAFVPDTKPVPPVKWLDATVPAGTQIEMTFIDNLSSATASKGNSFRTLVTDAIVIKDIVTVPSGSNVMGVVREVVPAATGFKGKGGMLLLEFNRIGTPTGASAPLKARLTRLKAPRGSAFLADASDPATVTAAASGMEVVVEPMTPVTIVLEQPLHIKVRQ
jgi:hypothetical protein